MRKQLLVPHELLAYAWTHLKRCSGHLINLSYEEDVSDRRMSSKVCIHLAYVPKILLESGSPPLKGQLRLRIRHFGKVSTHQQA